MSALPHSARPAAEPAERSDSELDQLADQLVAELRVTSRQMAAAQPR